MEVNADGDHEIPAVLRLQGVPLPRPLDSESSSSVGKDADVAGDGDGGVYDEGPGDPTPRRGDCDHNVCDDGPGDPTAHRDGAIGRGDGADETGGESKWNDDTPGTARGGEQDGDSEIYPDDAASRSGLRCRFSANTPH